MERIRISEVFKVGNKYDVITKYKEVPVKVNLKLDWIDEESRLLGFDWRKTHLKAAFSTLDPVYVKVGNREYLQTQVFSNLGKELVLSAENFVEPPEFINRRSVRVQPDENKPVVVEISFEGGNFEAQATDISETGVGISVDSKANREFVEFLKAKLEDLKEDEFIDFRIKVHLPENGTAGGTGRLKNVIGLGKDVYVRVGFEVDFPREEIDKIRRYVINRQKEIIQSLRFFK